MRIGRVRRQSLNDIPMLDNTRAIHAIVIRHRHLLRRRAGHAGMHVPDIVHEQLMENRQRRRVVRRIPEETGQVGRRAVGEAGVMLDHVVGDIVGDGVDGVLLDEELLDKVVEEGLLELGSRGLGRTVWTRWWICALTARASGGGQGKDSAR